MDYNPDHKESGAVVSDYVAQSISNNNIVYHLLISGPTIRPGTFFGSKIPPCLVKLQQQSGAREHVSEAETIDRYRPS